MNNIEEPLFAPFPVLLLREKLHFKLLLYSSLFLFVFSSLLFHTFWEKKNLKRTPFTLSFIATPWITTGKLVHYSYRPIKSLSNISQSGKTCIFQ